MCRSVRQDDWDWKKRLNRIWQIRPEHISCKLQLLLRWCRCRPRQAVHGESVGYLHPLISQNEESVWQIFRLLKLTMEHLQKGLISSISPWKFSMLFLHTMRSRTCRQVNTSAEFLCLYASLQSALNKGFMNMKAYAWSIVRSRVKSLKITRLFESSDV